MARRQTSKTEITRRILITAHSRRVYPQFVGEETLVVQEKMFLMVLRLPTFEILGVRQFGYEIRQFTVHTLDSQVFVAVLLDTNVRLDLYNSYNHELENRFQIPAETAVAFFLHDKYLLLLREASILAYDFTTAQKVAEFYGFMHRFSAYKSLFSQCSCATTLRRYEEALRILLAEGNGSVSEGCGKGSAKANLVHSKQFSYDQLQTLQREPYFCECCQRAFEIVAKAAELEMPSRNPVYGDLKHSSALQLLAAKSISDDDDDDWSFSDISFAKSETDLTFALYGSMPEIVFYRISFAVLVPSAPPIVYPSARVYGMLPNRQVRSSLLTLCSLATSFNLQNCKNDMFSDDILQVEFLECRESSVTARVFSYYLGTTAFSLDFLPAYIHEKSSAYNCTSVQQYDSEIYKCYEVNIVERHFIGQNKTKSLEWKKQCVEDNGKLYVLSERNIIYVIADGAIREELHIKESNELYGIAIINKNIYCWNDNKVLEICSVAS